MECLRDPRPSSTTDKIGASCDEGLPEVTNRLHSRALGKRKSKHPSQLDDSLYGLIRCSTVSGAFIVQETEDPIPLATRANSTSDIPDEPFFTPWEVAPTVTRKLTMPCGKFIQAKFSASGLTLMLLSDEQIPVHPMETSTAIGYNSPSPREPLMRNIKDFKQIGGSGKIRSVSISDHYILLRDVGEVRRLRDTLRSSVLTCLPEVAIQPLILLLI